MGGVGKEQVTKGLSKLSMQLTIPCLLFTTALDCSQNWSDDPCPDLWTSLTRGWPMLLLPLLYVFYVGCLLHSVAYEWGVACCATVLRYVRWALLHAPAKHAHLAGRRRTGLVHERPAGVGLLRHTARRGQCACSVALLQTIGCLLCC